MLDWLSQLLSNAQFDLFGSQYQRYQEWFSAIRAAYTGTQAQNWATSTAYNNAMTQYNDFLWHSSLLVVVGFLVMCWMFYKLASAFTGWYRLR